MENILLTIILMSFIIWFVRLLNDSVMKLHNNPQSTNNGLANSNIEKFSKTKLLAKNIVITLSIFLFCYMFILFIAKINQFNTMKYVSIEKFSKQYPENSMDITSNQDPLAKKLAQGYFEVVHPKQVKTLFSDVAGLYEAKEELSDLIKFLNNPIAFQRLGARPPKGILLYGQPGTGKTMLARALAGEAKVSFIATSGSQFEEEYVGDRKSVV